MTQRVLRVQNIYKSFHVGENDVQILRGIDFDVSEGDFLVLFGPSGCGKSTLLHTILGLESPTSGAISYSDSVTFSKMGEDDRSDFRKRQIGMIYQQSNWIRSLSVLDNVAFPLTMLGESDRKASLLARQALGLVGMLQWEAYIPMELSSGQQQRVALARAVATDPNFIIADEPTGNLDFESGQELMHLLKFMNEKKGKTILMVTHDLEYIGFAKSAIRMCDGQIVGKYTEGDREALMHRIIGKRGVEIS
ncbi:MAG: ABC transporter ATP-binding protein [Candidatus Moranbacteria bacterium]|nr:ABC transporter ATP-binding protein [Candidatus Moranbacteria bacterium]